MNRTPADNLKRFFAHIIDRFIAGFAIMIILMLLIPVDQIEQMITANHPSVLIVTFATYLAYYTLSTASGWQATPGKRMMGIYVIRADGKKLTQRDAFERFLAFYLPFLPVYISVFPAQVATLMIVLVLFWFLPIFSNPERMGLHDKLCNTRVVAGRTNA